MRSKKAVSLVSSLIPVLTLLAGCQSTTKSVDAPVCVGIVIGARANSAPVAAGAVSALLPEKPGVGSILAVTGVSGSANGDPTYTGTVAKADYSGDQEDEQINVRNLAVQAVNNMVASSPQADLLGAIEATAAQLRSTKVPCTVHVFDSGLQTIGLIHFQEGLLGASVEAVLNEIPQESTLKGVTVVFHTLGATTPPQTAPDSTALAALTAIWSGVVERRGGVVAETTVAASGSGAAERKSGLPPVDVVPIPRAKVDFGDIVQVCSGDSTTWTIPSDLLFAQGASELSATAKDALAKPASILVKHPSAQVTVVGYTSTEGTSGANQRLSESRAEAVKAFLLEAVGPTANVRTEGKGESEPTVDESGKTGASLEAARQANRRVTLRIGGINACKA